MKLTKIHILENSSPGYIKNFFFFFYYFSGIIPAKKLTTSILLCGFYNYLNDIPTPLSHLFDKHFFIY